jgi:hypothetical protein
MAFDMGGIGGMIIGWLLNPLIWIVIIAGVLGATWGILILRKRRKLRYECIELVDYAGGKFGYNLLKAGWFGKKKILFGLWDSGEEQLETKSGEVIYYFSTEDFQEINGKRGIICFRDSLNQDILVPITKTRVFCMRDGKKLTSAEVLAEIAPADFREIAGQIISDVDRETSDWKKQIIQYIIFGLIIVFALVSIIVITQMVKNGQDSASELIANAGNQCVELAKAACSEIAGTASGTAP